MANIVYIATSIDGFIAEKDGGIDWLINIPNPDGSDYGFKEFMESIDAVVMGRNTFDVVLKMGDWIYSKPVFVLSNTLKSIPDSLTGKAEIICDKPVEVIKELHHRNLNNLYIDGGKTIQQFLEEDLIDELIITRIPIVLGGGIPLFGEITKPQNYQLTMTEVFNKALIKTQYTRKRD